MSTPDRRISLKLRNLGIGSEEPQAEQDRGQSNVSGRSVIHENVKNVVICPKQLLIIHSGLDQEGPCETSEEKLVRLRTTHCTRSKY